LVYFLIGKLSKLDGWQNCGIGKFILSGTREVSLSRGILNRKFVGPQNELWGAQKAIEGGLQFSDDPSKWAHKAGGGCWGREGKVYDC